MANTPAGIKSISDIKSKLLQPALTSHYLCRFNLPPYIFGNSQVDTQGLVGGIKYWSRVNLGFEINSEVQDLVELSCCEASLPGSSLLTNEINNDYTGITERHAYRRSYDDRADFTFYVDTNYTIIKFFESWISYIANEKQLIESDVDAASSTRFESTIYNTRVRFPQDYQTDTLEIIKFERNKSTKNSSGSFMYRFLRAFPVSINSMPVSYDSSQLLKCTVSFVYSRYSVNYDYDPALQNPTIVGSVEIAPGLYQIQYIEDGQLKSYTTDRNPANE